MDPISIFRQRQDRFNTAIAQQQARLDQAAWVRLGVFLMALGLQIASWSWGGVWWLGMLLLGFIGFGMVVRWNEGLKRQMQHLQALLRINDDELRRIEGKLSGLDDGNEFINREHPYSSDLDIFGPHSLFQLVSRASTVFGRKRLAAWLLAPADLATVQARQAAAVQLAPELDWRQTLQATGEPEGQHERPEELEGWLAHRGLIAARPWLPTLAYALIAASVATIALELAGILPTGSWWITMIVNFLLNRGIAKAVGKEHLVGEKRGRQLAAWSQLLAQIEAAPGDVAAIQALKERLRTQGQPASAQIARLGRILTNLDFRSSGLPHFVVNQLMFWDIFCLAALDRWRLEVGPKVMDWFQVIGEMEALNSLAATRFAFPDWSNPELVPEGLELTAQGMGHPLLPPGVRVANPIDLRGHGAVWMVTGSNMSGKSTYLRTVGVNVVMGLMGAPVCARGMRLSQLQVATSMRTIDSLEENTSSFYAELKRLKSVIDQVRAEPRTLFLLDEILKGTNSRDRQAGARALVLQLHKLGGAGLVSTHDIELVDMAAQLPLAIHNYSFNCVVTEAGELEFDYTLTPGQCLSMNAVALMRAMGIEL